MKFITHQPLRPSASTQDSTSRGWERNRDTKLSGLGGGATRGLQTGVVGKTQRPEVGEQRQCRKRRHDVGEVFGDVAMQIDADPGAQRECAAGEQQPARLEVIEPATRDVIQR